MKIYKIDNHYVHYLEINCYKTTIYGKTKMLPHKMGVIVPLNHYVYFIPFALLKRKHYKLSSKQRDIVKLDNHTILNINNMIPISKTCKTVILKEVIINNIDYKPYRQILYNQLLAVNHHKEEIIKKATWLYYAMSKPIHLMNKYEKRLWERCFNFKELERKITNQDMI